MKVNQNIADFLVFDYHHKSIFHFIDNSKHTGTV